MENALTLLVQKADAVAPVIQKADAVVRVVRRTFALTLCVRMEKCPDTTRPEDRCRGACCP